MNKVIMLIADLGYAEQVRTLFIGIAAVAAVIMSMWYGKKIGMSNKRIFLLLMIAYPIDYILLELSFAGTDFAATNHILGIKTIVNSQSKTFVVIPLVALLVAKIIKEPWKVTADVLAVANLLNYAICSLGCIFTGCCVGYECSWGLYSMNTEKNTFPIQIVNAIIMLGITYYLLYRAKKLDYKPDGRQFPLKLILFGSTRFITEFFMDNEKLAFGLSIVAYHCVVMSIVGIIALIIINRKENKAKPLGAEVLELC